jgi:hypothetical protein
MLSHAFLAEKVVALGCDRTSEDMGANCAYKELFDEGYRVNY